MPVNNPIPPTASGIEPLGIALEVEELLQADLTSIHTKLDGISSELNGLEVNVDLTPIQSKLTTIEQKVDALSGTTSTFTPELEYLKFISHYWIDANDLSENSVDTELTSWTDANGRLGTGAFTLKKSPNGIKWANFPSGKYISFPLKQRDFNYFDAFILAKKRNPAHIWLLGEYAIGRYFTYLAYPYFLNSHSFLYFAYAYGLAPSFVPDTWVVEHIRFGGFMGGTTITTYNPSPSSISGGAYEYIYTRDNYIFGDYLSIGEAVPMSTSGCDCDIAKFIMFFGRDKFQLRQQDIATIKDYLLTQIPN